MSRGKTTFEFADRGKGRLHFPYVVLPKHGDKTGEELKAEGI